MKNRLLTERPELPGPLVGERHSNIAKSDPKGPPMAPKVDENAHQPTQKMSPEVENNTRFGARGCSWIPHVQESRNMAVRGTKLIWALGRSHIDAVFVRYVWMQMLPNQQKNKKKTKDARFACSVCVQTTTTTTTTVAVRQD